MGTARGVVRGLLIFIALIFTAGWATIFTLQQTVLNRATVFGWLDGSGFYSSFVNTVVQLQASPETGGGDSELNTDALQKAINSTLSPAFIKQSTETVLTSFYDWIEGKSTEFEFAIPLAQKKPDLQAELAKALEPQLATLPKCTSKLSVSDTPDCIPAGSTPAAMAADLSARSVNSSDFLSQPLTAKDLGQNITQPLEPLRLLTTNLPWLVIVLPAVAVLCVVGYILLAPDKIKALGMAGRRLLFATLAGLIAGAAMWLFGGQLAFGEALGDAQIVSTLVDPLIQRIVPDVGKWLAVSTGVVAAVGGLMWLASIVMSRLKPKPHELTDKLVSAVPSQPTPGASDHTEV